MGRIWKTTFVDIAVETGAYAIGDALGSKNSFVRVPEHGYIVGAVLQDRDSEKAPIDIVIFDNADIGGTADNAAFAPTDGELGSACGVIRISEYFTFSNNSIGVANGFKIPYWAKAGSLYFQCQIQAVHSYTAIDDVLIALYLEIT